MLKWWSCWNTSAALSSLWWQHWWWRYFVDSKRQETVSKMLSWHVISIEIGSHPDALWFSQDQWMGKRARMWNTSVCLRVVCLTLPSSPMTSMTTWVACRKAGPGTDSNPTSPREGFVAEGLGNGSSLNVRRSGLCSGLLISFNLIVVFCHTYFVCHANTSGLQWFKVV